MTILWHSISREVSEGTYPTLARKGPILPYEMFYTDTQADIHLHYYYINWLVVIRLSNLLYSFKKLRVLVPLLTTDGSIRLLPSLTMTISSLCKNRIIFKGRRSI